MASEKLVVAGRISASISHEIKNPLETASNALYLLATDRRMPSDLVELARAATAELKRADQIAGSNLSLLQTSTEALPLALAELVKNVLDLQAAQWIGHNISVERRLRVPVPLQAYAGELRQILINLVQNAAAAIGSQGRILVRVQPRHSPAGDEHQRGYSITIADTGPGIEPDNRARLFTMFFTTKGEQRTGMAGTIDG